MEKIMVLVFDDETKAHHGIRALQKLDDEGNIEIHAGALVRKDENGTHIIPNADLGNFPIGTLTGTMLGAVIGMIAGPAGIAVGAGMGSLTGLAGDLAMATIDEDLVYEVSQQLQP